MLNRPKAPWLDRSAHALDWNGPAHAFGAMDDAVLEQPLAALFAAAARAHPDRIALDDGTTRLTYAQAQAAVARLAGRIAAQTAPDGLIGILLPTSTDFPVAMLACLAAGRLFVPLDSHYPHAWLGDVIGDCGMTAVIGRFDDADSASLVPEHVRRIDLNAPDGATLAPAPRGPDAPAFVLFTSGSTGKPKGIVNSQRALTRRVAQYVNAAHVGADDRFLPLSSECTIAGLRERFAALLSGATLHLIDVQRDGARQILNRLRGARITMIYGVPALLRTLMQLEPHAPDSLRVIRVGGDAVLWSDVDALRAWAPAARIELGYSSTEAPIMQWFVPDDFTRDGPKVPLGYPLAGNALAILDANGAPVAAGAEGELVVRSPYVALGRWRAGRVDGTDFPADPDDAACRVLRTGDLVRLRPDGLIDLAGRKDRQLKIRGVRVEPAELEAALRRHRGTGDVAVYPRRIGTQWWLIGYVTGDADLAALKAALRQSLPAALQPQRLYRIEAIPRLASAKLDMNGLSAIDEACERREAEAAPVARDAPVGAAEETIAALWREILGREAGRHDDFFDCGGDSLSTLNLMFAIEEAFGVALPVTAIYGAPTIAALAAAVAQSAPAAFSPLVCIRPGDGTPLFIVHGVGGNVMELFALGRQVAGDGPVYALQARGLDGREPPHTSIAAMAQDYLAAIRAAFPRGRFHLAGYSAGGLIAFEMACRERPASLTLLDTQTHQTQWPWTTWLRHVAKRARHHAGVLGTSSWRGGLDHVRKLLDRGRAAAPDARVPAALQAVHDATMAAVMRYRPGRYAGEVALVVPQVSDPWMTDVTRLWRGRVAALRVLSVPGDHRSMVQGANAAHVAAALSSVLSA